MDEVLADTLSEHIARYNREHGEAVTKADLEGKWMWDIVSADRHERLTAYLHAEDFFEDLPVVVGQPGRPIQSWRALRHLHCNGRDGVSKLLRSQVSMAAETLPFCAGVELRLLRRQGSCAGELSDR